MRPIMKIVASNGLAILLTIICVLPITAIFAYSLTAPLDNLFSNLGLWLRESRDWSLAAIDVELRFVDDGSRKRGTIRVNGYETGFSTTDNEIVKEISKITSQ